MAAMDDENDIQTLEQVNIAEMTASTNADIPEQSQGRRAMLMAATRMRAYNADLTKAHIALMEREVLLPSRQLELFRLVNRHYRTLQSWHDQYTGWRISRSPTVIRLVRNLSATNPRYRPQSRDANDRLYADQ